MRKYDIDGLNGLYESAERVDKEVFSEMRSNLLLVSGEHYTKRTSKFFARLRNTNRLSEVQKLRITKNHIHKISRYYVNSILEKVPGVQVVPHNDLEKQDQKAAELSQAVWNFAKNKYNLKSRIREWAHNFVDVGEVCVKVFYNPDAGELIGFRPKKNKDGEDEKSEDGVSLVPDTEQPVFSGAFDFETVEGFNLLRSPFAKSMQDSPYLIVRKMVDIQKLKSLYADQEDKLEFIQKSEEEAYVVFQSHKSHYTASQNEVLVREYYFRPSKEYPEGYFYISTKFGVLEEGPLPFGIYPLVWAGFDEYATAPRAKSIIKVARPYQAEINRAASQQATHQVSVGDDKIIYQSGTKLAPGALLPGVRGLTYQGTPPQILPGREGSQFVNYISQQISEMYAACMVEEINLEKDMNNIDPFSLLFKSASQQQKFAQYTEKFEEFLRRLCTTYLELARIYFPEDMVVQAVGRSEAINIVEFKNADPLCYYIKVEPQSDTVDTRLGKQMALNHVLQYVGNKLENEDIGKIIKTMPYLNTEDIFNDMILDKENVDNDMLALERGEMPTVSPYANNEYYDKRLTTRMKQADFQLLDKQVQENYQLLLDAHRQEIARKQQEIMDAKNEYIPVGGAMVTVQMHMPDPQDPTKAKQVRLPYQALDWLINTLEKQNMGLERLEAMSQQSQIDVYNRVQPGQQTPFVGASLDSGQAPQTLM